MNYPGVEKNLWFIQIFIRLIYFPMCNISNEKFAQICLNTKSTFGIQIKNLLVSNILSLAKRINFRIAFRLQELTLKQLETYFQLLQDQHAEYLKYSAKYKSLPSLPSRQDKRKISNLNNTVKQLRSNYKRLQAQVGPNRPSVELHSSKMGNAFNFQNKVQPIITLGQDDPINRIEVSLANRQNETTAQTKAISKKNIRQIDDEQSMIANHTVSFPKTNKQFPASEQPRLSRVEETQDTSDSESFQSTSSASTMKDPLSSANINTAMQNSSIDQKITDLQKELDLDPEYQAISKKKSKRRSLFSRK